MSGSRWVITPSSLSGSWTSFLYSSSVYSCHLFLISSASVRSIPFLSFIKPIFAWNVPLVSLIFLKRSLVFPILLFSFISLHWSLRRTFLSLLAILWNSAFKWEYLSNIRWIIKKTREFQKNIYFCFIDYANAFDCVDHNKLWKILKEFGISDHMTYLLRNLYAVQEATVRSGHGTTDWFQIGKRVRQGCILSPCLFNLYAEYIMRSIGLDEAKAGIKIARRNINISSANMQMTPPLWQRVKRN